MSANTLDISSADIIQLIQHYLTECGLLESSKALLKETEIGCRGLLPHAQKNLLRCAKRGDWGVVLETLSTITVDDGTSNRRLSSANGKKEYDEMLVEIHEMAILELADLGEMELAFATLKTCRPLLDSLAAVDSNVSEEMSEMNKVDVIKSLERKLNSVAALRSSVVSSTVNQDFKNMSESFLPPDYWGLYGKTKQGRRDEIVKKMSTLIPIIPTSRLVALFQHAIKWQCHTGEIPMVKEVWEAHIDEMDNDKKKRKRRQKKVFDLVMGDVSVEVATSDRIQALSESQSNIYESIPKDPYSTLKMSKKTVVTSCTFLQNESTCSLVTGSSDGFIEIWDELSKYTELRMDLEYQKKDELMCHYGTDDTNAPSIHAITVNNAGTMLASGDSNGSISIWEITSGRCLHTFEKVMGGAVTCLDFSIDGEDSSRILCASQDGNCREFGLRTKRLLKEFRGHSSFVHSCIYVITTDKSADKTSPLNLLVVTASADSTVRVWCGRSAEVKCVINPMGATGPSAIVSISSTSDVRDKGGSDRSIHSVLPLHSPSDTMIIVPHGPKAFLVTYTGLILRTFEVNVGMMMKSDETSASFRAKGDIVCATISPTNKWLYAVSENGYCTCFDVHSGKIETVLQDFALETTGGKTNVEINGICHHPLKGILAAYSSSNLQKRGVLTLWK